MTNVCYICVTSGVRNQGSPYLKARNCGSFHYKIFIKVKSILGRAVTVKRKARRGQVRDTQSASIQADFIHKASVTNKQQRQEKKLFQQDKTFCRAGSAAGCLPRKGGGGGGGGVKESGQGRTDRSKRTDSCSINANHKFE